MYGGTCVTAPYLTGPKPVNDRSMSEKQEDQSPTILSASFRQIISHQQLPSLVMR